MSTQKPNTMNKVEHSIITKGFLDQVLSANCVSFKVNEGCKPGENYTSLIFTIDVELENNCDFLKTKRRLLLKCYPQHPARQEFANKSNLFFTELEVYSKWIPELQRFQKEILKVEEIGLPYVKFIQGRCINYQSSEGQIKINEVFHPLDNYLMMEDIRKTRGFRMTNPREPLDIHHMRLVFTELAKIHAHSWAYKHHVNPNVVKTFPCFKPNFCKEDMSLWVNMIGSHLELCKVYFGKEFGPGNKFCDAAERFKEQAREVASYFFIGSEGGELEKLLRVRLPVPEELRGNNEPWRIISHGDTWSNNMLFRYDQGTGKPVEVVLIDLQFPQESCVANDLVYVIYRSTDGFLRRNHLDELLQLYHDKFNFYCDALKTPTLPGFCIESLKYRFHCAKHLGYFMAVVGLPMILKEENNVVDMDKIEQGADLEAAFKQIIAGQENNVLLKERIIDVTRDLIEDGVL